MTCVILYFKARSGLPLFMATEITNRVEVHEPSLPEVYSSVRISKSPFYWKRLAGFLGPGFLIAVGYMDPGNWATDIAGGSRYGYTLLSVIMISNLMAILLQSLSLKLGVATERDLAQLCRESTGRVGSFILWVMALQRASPTRVATVSTSCRRPVRVAVKSTFNRRRGSTYVMCC